MATKPRTCIRCKVSQDMKQYPIARRAPSKICVTCRPSVGCFSSAPAPTKKCIRCKEQKDRDKFPVRNTKMARICRDCYCGNTERDGKTCVKCLKKRPDSKFIKNGGNYDGLTYSCVDCYIVKKPTGLDKAMYADCREEILELYAIGKTPYYIHKHVRGAPTLTTLYTYKKKGWLTVED